MDLRSVLTAEKMPNNDIYHYGHSINNCRSCSSQFHDIVSQIDSWLFHEKDGYLGEKTTKDLTTGDHYVHSDILDRGEFVIYRIRGPLNKRFRDNISIIKFPIGFWDEFNPPSSCFPRGCSPEFTMRVDDTEFFLAVYDDDYYEQIEGDGASYVPPENTGIYHFYKGSWIQIVDDIEYDEGTFVPSQNGCLLTYPRQGKFFEMDVCQALKSIEV